MDAIEGRGSASFSRPRYPILFCSEDAEAVDNKILPNFSIITLKTTPADYRSENRRRASGCDGPSSGSGAGARADDRWARARWPRGRRGGPPGRVTETRMPGVQTQRRGPACLDVRSFRQSKIRFHSI